MLAYDQPIERVGAKDRAMARSTAGLHLVDLSRLLWRRRIMIASAALICACVGVTIGNSLSPKYTATAQLYVDPRDAAAYLAESRNSQATAAGSGTSDLSGRLKDLQERLRNAEDALATYKAQNNFVGVQDTLISDQQLSASNQRLAAARAQASVRLRELERDVEASRDVYQSFLERPRETQEQESLNTSAARVIGEATVQQRRAFPPAMSLIATIGFLIGGLAAVGWIVMVDRLRSPTPTTAPAGDVSQPREPAPEPPSQSTALEPLAAPSEKPLIARMQDSDVMRTLGGILASGGIADVTKLGWPTLRTGQPSTVLIETLREIRAAAARRSPTAAMPVVAVIGAGDGNDRSIVALNFALAVAGDHVKVLLIDADPETGTLSGRLSRFGRSEPSSRGWLSIGSEASREILTANGMSVLPAIKGVKGIAATQKALARARAVGGHQLAILDGPAMPWSEPDRELLEGADALVAVLPVSIDINEAMEEIIDALGDSQAKLVGVILNELKPPAAAPQRGKQYA